jgi:hypothetical protein
MTWVAFAHGYAIADMVSTIATSLSLVSVAAPRQQSVSVLRRRSFIEPVMVTWRSMVAAIAISSPAPRRRDQRLLSGAGHLQPALPRAEL